LLRALCILLKTESVEQTRYVHLTIYLLKVNKLKYNFVPDEREFEEAKRLIFEEAMSSGTIGELDVDSPALTYSLIPYLVWREISLGAERTKKLGKAVYEVDITAEEGNTIHVATLDRDEFTAQTISEDDLDNSGFTKTKLSPSSVQLQIGDIIYVASRISDVLQEDSKLGWVRAMLQKMGEAIAKKIETDIEAELYAESGDTNLVACSGSLTFAKVLEAKKILKNQSWFDTEEPFILFMNPENEEDLLTEAIANGVSSEEYKEGSLEDFYGDSIYAKTMVVVSEHVRSGFAYMMVAPTDFRSASLLFAWKRKPKIERDRDSQYGRDKYFLTTRYAVGEKQTTSLVQLSGC